MKTYRPFVLLFLLIAFVISCQKERSFENGGGPPSHGSLQSGTTGDCLGSTVQGVYKKDSILGAGNYVDVVVDVTTPGWFVISTDTINNIYFRATGNFSVAGIDTVRLHGSGKPTAASTNVFTVTYDSSSCTFSVTTLPGGGGTSVFTLAGSPGNCVPGTVSGSYNVGTALNAGDSVVVAVNVTTPGTWSITTSTLGGMTFSGSGTFATAGVATIKLIGTGTPTTAGSFNFPISAGANTCSFTVTVTSLCNDYYPRTTGSNWSYIFNNDPADTLYRNVISTTKSAIGNTYNIFMENDGTGPDSSGYFRKTSGGDYYQYADMGFIFGLDGPVWGEYIFLKDYVASGTSWTSSNFAGSYTDTTTHVTSPVLIRIKETIQQKNVSVVVRGVTYPNTIEMKEEYEYSFDNGANWTLSDVYSVYDYSRCVGLIKWEVFDATGSLLLEEIKRSQVF